MAGVSLTLVSAAGLFVDTNIDGMVVLAVLNVSAQAKGRPAGWHIWVSQYAGIAAQRLVSLVAAIGLTVVPEGPIWLLEVVPPALGLRKLLLAIRAQRSGGVVSAAVATGLPGVIGLTIANGGDNLAAYTPVSAPSALARPRSPSSCSSSALRCGAYWLSWLVSHRKITLLIRHWDHWIIPAVFILIGLYIFHKTDALA